jgi:hypothetical protein
VRFVRRGLRGPLAQLTVRLRCVRVLALTASALAVPWIASAQSTPAPHPSATITPPKVPLHAELFVDTNKLGQVSHVVSIKPSPDKGFNTQVYGNASQAFIRKPDGGAVAGLYRLTYDYDPKTQKVRRTVELVKAGGVDPDAPGIVTVLQKSLNDAQKRTPSSNLPDFDKIIHPSPTPH